MQELKASNKKYVIKKKQDVVEVVTLSGHEKGCMYLQSVYFDDFSEQLLIAVKLYVSQYAYVTDYILLDRDMNMVEVLSETEGVIPSFLSAPDKSIWVELASTKSENNDKIVILPLRNRQRIKKDIFLRDLGMEYRLNDNGETIDFFIDSFDRKKPDKMYRLLFSEDGLFKKRAGVTIPLPQKSIPAFSNHMIQLINMDYTEKTVLHREMNLKGEIERERVLSLGLNYHFVFPLSLAFTQTSSFFVTIKNEVFIVHIGENGSVEESKSLAKVNSCNEFYSIWKPVILRDSAIIKYTYENGNGFMVIQNNEMKECWIHPKGSSVWRDQLSGKEMDFQSPSLLLQDILAVSDRKYALCFAAIAVDATDKKIKILLKPQ